MIQNQSHSEFTVLIVDDEPALVEALALDFEMSGCRVLTAESGNRAFEIFRSQLVDVVLTDVRMPDGDGVELLERIKKLKPEIPVIFMTGFAGVTLDEARAKGAETIVWKPFDLAELSQTVLRYKERRAG